MPVYMGSSGQAAHVPQGGSASLASEAYDANDARDAHDTRHTRDTDDTTRPVSRASSRLSTNTFGFTCPTSPNMNSEAESWRTALQSSSQITITTAGTHGDYDEQDFDTEFDESERDLETQAAPITPPSPGPVMSPTTTTTHTSTSTPTSSSTFTSTPPASPPMYGASTRVASLPELSRSTSTVNPATPSTIHFPRMDQPHGPHVLSSGSRRSVSLSSLKETLADDEKVVVDDVDDKWRHGRFVYHGDGYLPRSNREIVVYDEGHGHGHDHDHDHGHGHANGHAHGHVHGPGPRSQHHNYSTSTADAGEWEDIETDGKELVSKSEAEAEPNAPPAWTTEIPTPEQVRDAAGCHLLDEWGNTVRFGDMLPGGPAWRSASLAGKPVKKVLTLFVGHWWCGLCHDYAIVSVAKLSPAALIREGVRVVIISSGSWKVIAKYRATFDVKFPVFVDNGTRLYRALGLPKSTPNPFAEAMVKDRPAYHQHPFARQMATGMVRGIFQFGGIRFRNPGNFMQLGGEFVFGLDYSCDYAHRMQGRGDHCEAPDVLSAVGVQSTLGAPMSNTFEEERAQVRRRIRAGSHM